MAGEELDRRADIGAGRIGISSRVGLGNGYPINWGCKAGGLEGGTGVGGNEGPRVN